MQKLSREKALVHTQFYFAGSCVSSGSFRASLAVFLLLLLTIASSATTVSAQPYVWSHTHLSPAECVAFNPLSKGKTVFFASKMEKGIFRSDDGGMTWIQYWQGMSDLEPVGIMQIHCLESDTNILHAITPSFGIYRSTNGGQTWRHIDEFFGILGEAMTWHKGTDALYYGQFYKGPIWKSLDHGETWIQSGEASEEAVLCTISISPDDNMVLLAGSGEGGIASSSTEGASWKSVFPMENPDEVIRPEVPKIVWSSYAPGFVFATRWLSQDSQLIRSSDWGKGWAVVGMDLPRTWAFDIDQKRERTDLAGPNARGPMRFWVGLFNRGLEPNEVHSVIETRDAGESWIGTGIPDVEQVWMIKHDTTEDRLVAATNLGIFVTKAIASVKPGDPSHSLQFSNNPASNATELILPKNEILQSLELFDAGGRRMLIGHTTQIATNALANGSYTAVIRTSSGEYTLALIVQH